MSVCNKRPAPFPLTQKEERNIRSKIDELIKSLEVAFSVIPANPGSGPGQAPESGSFHQL
jgi:hypothetical protein